MSETQRNRNRQPQDERHDRLRPERSTRSRATDERETVSFRTAGSSYRAGKQPEQTSVPQEHTAETTEKPRFAKQRLTLKQEHPYASQYRGREAQAPDTKRTTPHEGRATNAPESRQNTRTNSTYTPYSTETPRRKPGQYDRGSANPGGSYRDTQNYRQQKRSSEGLNIKKLGTLALALVVVIIGITVFVQTRPVAITVNGTAYELGGEKNIQTILEEGWAAPQPGDFVAVDGSVLETKKGEALSATVNGEQITDITAKLSNNAIVEINDGVNIVEPSQNTTEILPHEIIEAGVGAIHVIGDEGADGVNTTKVGDVSGKTFVEKTTAVQNRSYSRYSPNVGSDKVIAFTFDDGPWPGSTSEVLDVLDEHSVKATFFTIGTRIDEAGKPLVKRAYDAGHQICTHSFDHARGSGKGVDMGLMAPEEQIAEIEKGYAAIKDATGSEVSRVFRSPGGNFAANTQKNVAHLIDSEIGWNIDTGDWRRPGAEAIAEQMKSAKPGDVILCHDGGGDRSQTVEALKIAIPYLKEQGYRFITMDELLAYPPA